MCALFSCLALVSVCYDGGVFCVGVDCCAEVMLLVNMYCNYSGECKIFY